MTDFSKLKIALYARKSTETSDKQVQSIPDQIKWAKDRAGGLGIPMRRSAVFQEAKSAKAPGNRPEFDRLVAEIKAGKYDALICWATNRLSRNPQEAGIIQQLLQDSLLKCIVTNDKIYLPEDNAVVFAVEMGISSQFIRDLMANVRRGMHSKAERGWLPGVPPIGYKNDPIEKTIIIDEERFPLARQMWDLMLSGGYTASQIARIADREWGLRTLQRKRSGGRPLAISGVYMMLQNPFYMGQVRYGGKTYPGKHTPMVTYEEFMKVQALIKRRSTARPELRNEPDPFPYRGLVRCGECGCLITFTRKIKRQKNGNVHIYDYCYCTRRRFDYDCSQRAKISPKELTERIREELKQYTIMDDFFQWAVKYIREFDDAESARQEQVYQSQVKAIQATENELRELHRMRYRGQIDDGFYSAEKQQLESRLLMLRGQFNEQEDKNKSHRQVMEKYFNFARYAQEDFESDDDAKKKEVLSIIGQNLLFKDDELLFEPVKYLQPVVNEYPALAKRYERVGTLPKQRQEAALASIISDWYPGQDSNLRP